LPGKSAWSDGQLSYKNYTTGLQLSQVCVRFYRYGKANITFSAQ